MLATWKYRERGTLYQQLDPRARLLFAATLTLAIVQVWDPRWLLGFLLVAVLHYAATRLRFHEMRGFWIFVPLFISAITVLTFVTGRGGIGIYADDHIIWQAGRGWWAVTVSSERIAFALSQWVRLLAMALLVSVLPFTLHPARYGVTFRRLGIGDKFAVATDLAVRFVPNLAADFQTTIDAQRARGYELERAGGVWKALRNLAPLVVPVTIGSILKGEELIDAMDLRAFGTGPRSWLEQLCYRAPDLLLLTLGIGTLLVVTYYNIFVPGAGDLWVPDWFIALAAQRYGAQ